ncbi:hypothetical protein JYG23_07680 [Sedimentibacter sp. zth1]|uniref:DUF6199 family natural product biosynthesis protein n=1 Tax=Sedimentibacter sp. zth1 TaxID=2816908 RepID=UPI001A92A7BC|nr:DUF6199 family natural product biosynthesis protein [Sedimentibacter sp. zth1]QSX07213.1 hypothetical protein JYG23_07680 [Sedimentibacter sp. zth1]
MKTFVGILIVIVGLVDLLFPNFGWYISCGWKYENAEPSDVAFKVYRLLGLLIIIAGFIYIYQ